MNEMKQISGILVAFVVMAVSSCSTSDELDAARKGGLATSSGIPVIIGINSCSYDDSTYSETLAGWSHSGTRSDADAAHGTDNSNTLNTIHRDGKLSTLMVGDRFNIHFISGVTAELSRYRIDRAITYEDPDASMTDPSGTLTDEEYRKQHARVKRAIAVAETMVNGVADASNPQPFFLDGATTAYCRAYYPAMNPIVPALWTVERDQSTLAGVRKSDLMFAEGTADASISGAATPLTTIQMAPFQHRMSRLRVTLSATPLTSKVKKIEIVGGVNRQVNILDTEKLITGNDLRVPCTESEPLLMCPVGNYPDYMDYAVLLPAQVLCQQTVAGARVKLLRITLVNNTMIEMEMEPKKILAGKTYTINLGILDNALVGQTISLGSWNETQTVSYQYASGAALTGSSKGIYQIGNTTFRMLNVEADPVGHTVHPPHLNVDKLVKYDGADFQIGETELTQALWKEVMGDYPTVLGLPQKTYGDDIPVTVFSWGELKTFINRLNTLTASQRPAGYTFKLPTKEQWMYAAQGGKYSKGYDLAGGNAADISKVAWWGGASGNGGSETVHPSAKLRANELGLYDMSGNLWEVTRTVNITRDYGGNPEYNFKTLGAAFRHGEDILLGNASPWNDYGQGNGWGSAVKPDGHFDSPWLDDYGVRLVLDNDTWTMP